MNKGKYYILDMFPYPSGEGLHVGHPKGYISTDILSRYKKMNGFEVIHPMGWDAFGLPAEQYAIKNKVHPSISTQKNINNFKNQLNKINLDYDWDREISTIDPKFYKWTQWIFKQMYKKGLAWQSSEPINWCPSCKTGLANEDLEGNACERCDSIVEKKPLRQWVLNIVQYADRLIDDLDELKWPEWVKVAQRNWIGISEGSEIDFEIVGLNTCPLTPEGEGEIQNTGLTPALSKGEGVLPGYYTGDIKNYESLKIFADEMKKSQTESESIMWNILRKDFSDNRFRRQHIIDNFIVDFVCLKKGIIIEVDGDIHDLQKDKDEEREKILKSYGFRFLRFKNDDIKNNIEQILNKLKTELAFDSPSPLEKGIGDEAMSHISIFTTRADTIFGATFMAINYNIAKKWIENGWGASSEILEIINKIENEEKNRAIDFDINKLEKIGIDTGIKAINPANNKEIPIYIANYILSDYGTGAIMAVPAHDERDYEFAKKYNIEIKQSVAAFFENKEDLKVRNDCEIIKRRNIHAIIRNPKNNKYLFVKFKKEGWQSMVTGGVEEGESLIESAIREVKEETGYKNLIHIKSHGDDFVVHSKFFAPHKNVNRYMIASALCFDLIDEDKAELVQEEKDLLDIVWIDADQAENYMTHINQKMIWNACVSNFIFTGDGILINSDQFNDMTSEEARQKITEYVGGEIVKKYKLKDWVFARQRYWGEPFPIVFATKENGDADYKKSFLVADSELPVRLPEVDNYEPTGTGESPLANIREFTDVYGYINNENEFISCDKSDSKSKLFKRETNTMPQWAGSSWYWLRFLDPNNDNSLIDSKIEKEWPQVDVYVGGDHATRHLIYARFWHKFLFDIGVVSNKEPFKRLEFLGFILAEDGRKMSKRFGNVINPDDIVDRYGSDVLRLYEMFMAPFEATAVWNTSNIAGVERFVKRIEKLKDKIGNECQNKNIIHQTIKKVGEDIEAFRFNTAISQMMILLNELESKGLSIDEYKIFIQILWPFAPEICERLSKEMNIEKIWPTFDENKILEDNVNIAFQVNGKLRDTIFVPINSEQDYIMNILKDRDSYKKYITTEPKKIIFVKNKIVNVVG